MQRLQDAQEGDIDFCRGLEPRLCDGRGEDALARQGERGKLREGQTALEMVGGVTPDLQVEI